MLITTPPPAGPVATVTSPAPRAVTSRSVGFSWSATDAGGATVTGYNVRVRSTAYDAAAPAAWQQPAALQGTTATSVTLPVNPGADRCVEVQATDSLGVTGAWSSPRCAARFLDDRSLRAAGRWHRARDRNAFHHTLTATTVRGATLSLAGVRADHVWLLVTRCVRCGTVRVQVGTSAARTAHLRSSAYGDQRVIGLRRFPVASGAATVTVTSRGEPVAVDGIAFSQT